MNVHLTKFNFSVQQLGVQREKFQHKICFKKDLNHLRLKSSPALAVTTRLFRDGNFLRLYKQLQKSFLINLLSTVHSLPHNNEFKNLYYQYQSFRDLNRILFWKLMSVNCLFNIKKLKNKRILFYLRPERRAILALLWLKNIVKLKKQNHSNCSPSLFIPVFNFIRANKNVNDIFSLKLRVYKLRLVRG
jgi:hypothetical protein